MILCLLLFTALVQPGLAQEQSRLHAVREGETLFNIAQQYGVTVEQLRSWNYLSGNELSVGQMLVVRPLDSELAAADTVRHQVQSQETLFSISKLYNVSIAEIQSWNNLENNILEVGQELVLYPPERSAAETTGESTGSLVVNTPVGSNTYYTVRSGDTLYQIALQHNMTVQELQALNDLTSTTIRVGQQLTVRGGGSAPSISEDGEASSPQGQFVIHTLTEEQNLQQVLDRFSMTETEFAELNPDLGRTQFQAGQTVTVLAPPSESYKNPYMVQASLRDLGQTAVSAYDTTRAGYTTTSGELYNPDQFTAAHANIALGDVIFVQNPANNRGVYVRINDRFSGNGLKLSEAALSSLGITATPGVRVNIYQDQ